MENVAGNVGIRPKMNKNLKAIIVLAALVLALFAGYYVYNTYMTEEGKANIVIKKYIKAIQNTDSTYGYKKGDVDDFYNVFSYKHIKTYPVEKVDRTYKFDYDYYSRMGDYDDDVKNFTFGKYLDKKRDLYKRVYQNISGAKIVTDTLEVFEFASGDKYNEYSIVYDLEITNREGQKLFKKVIFVLDNESDEYLITKIYNN